MFYIGEQNHMAFLLWLHSRITLWNHDRTIAAETYYYNLYKKILSMASIESGYLPIRKHLVEVAFSLFLCDLSKEITHES